MRWVKMCEDFECIDCPAINTTNCYYYGKGFMDYYKKIHREKYGTSSKWSLSIGFVDLTSNSVL